MVTTGATAAQQQPDLGAICRRLTMAAMKGSSASRDCENKTLLIMGTEEKQV